MTIYTAVVDTAGRAPTHGNPGGGGTSSGPWFWIGIVFIVLVASYVLVRWLRGHRT